MSSGKKGRNARQADASREAVTPPFVAAAPAVIETAEAVIEAAVAETVAAGDTVSDTIEQRTETMMDTTTQTFEAAANTGTDRAQAAFGEMNERTKAAVEKSSKLFEDATELTKGNVEALVASSRIAARGAETIGQEAAEFGRKSFEEASAVLKRMAEVKSPTELFKLQSDYARSAFDAMIAESSKLSETMLKLAGEVAEPLATRYTAAADKVKTLAA